jgi:ABC-type glycerol-3-phosphate transport system permease component
MDFKIIPFNTKLYQTRINTCFRAPDKPSENALAAHPVHDPASGWSRDSFRPFHMQMPFPSCLAAATATGLPPSLFLSILTVWLPNLLLIAAVTALPLHFILRGISSRQEDAAIMDGCGFWRTLSHILLPRLGPVLVIATVAFLILGWEDVSSARVVVLSGPGGVIQPDSTSTFRLLSSAVVIHGHVMDSGAVAAFLTLLASPLIAFLYLLQRYVLRGRFTAS